jgi:predicted permease
MPQSSGNVGFLGIPMLLLLVERAIGPVLMVLAVDLVFLWITGCGILITGRGMGSAPQLKTVGVG